MKVLCHPFDEKSVRSLRTGDAVSISGMIHTGRDKFHKFFADGGKVPVDFRDGALYHCGPVCVKADDGWKVVSAGPTTSVRENPYEPAFIAASGVRVIIGKGGMDAATLAAMKAAPVRSTPRLCGAWPASTFWTSSARRRPAGTSRSRASAASWRWTHMDARFSPMSRKPPPDVSRNSPDPAYSRTTAPPFAETRISAPGGYLPAIMFFAIGFSSSRWIALFTGRAPKAGS